MNKLALSLLILTFTAVCHAEIRSWTTSDGKTFEAEFINVIGDKAVFQSGKKQLKISYDSLSETDKEYIALSNPPKLDITFTKSSVSRHIQTSPVFQEAPPRINDFTFGAKVRQTSAGDYPFELEIEYFAIGQELRGNRFILLDRDKRTFTLTRENKLAFDFKGERLVEVMQYDMKERMFGREYAGNLVTITDKRGVIIGYSASNEWLYDNIENLKQLPLNAYFDETCTRQYPTPPKSWY